MTVVKKNKIFYDTHLLQCSNCHDKIKTTISLRKFVYFSWIKEIHDNEVADSFLISHIID